MLNRELKQNFISRVKKQAHYYNDLKEVMTQEERTLLGKDINALDAIVKKEEEIINNIKLVEDEKKVLFRDLATEAGFKDPEDLTLKEVLPQLEETDAREIEKAVMELIEAVRVIDAVNTKNLHVIKNFVEYADFAKTMKEKMEAPQGAAYDGKGYRKNEPPAKKLNIDQKI